MNNKELVDLCKNGNEQALDLLYKTYADKMLEICSYYVRDKQAAQDILHDGFIVIISSIHSLRSPNKLESWMRKIIRNLSLRYLEQCNMTTTISLDEISYEEEPIDYDYADEFPPYNTILQLIEKLPAGYCKIFKLAVLEGLSHSEISSILHIAPHSSSSQLSRAKEMLRKLLSQYRMIGLLALLSALSLYIFQDERDKSVSKEQVKSDGWKDEVQQTETPFHTDTINSGIPSLINFRQVQDEHVAANVVRKEDMSNICPDSIIERKDKSIDTNKKKGKYELYIGENLYNNITPQLITGRNKNWILSISYSGTTNQTAFKKSIIPGSITSGGPKEILEKSYHRAPVVFSLSAQKKMNVCWGIETGIQYTLLCSEFTSSGDAYWEQAQKIHYIGIPLKGNFNIGKSGKFSIYTSVGLTLDVRVCRNERCTLFFVRPAQPTLSG